MVDVLVLVAALVAAVGWIIYQQRVLAKATARLVRMDKRVNSARMTLTAAKSHINACLEENEMLKTVLTDVAKGEAHVWIGEDGDIRATRTVTGAAPLH